MIEKMKFLSITGPKADLDRVVDKYLSKYEIHLENALSELKTVAQLRPFIEINPYREWLQKAEELTGSLTDTTAPPTEITLEEAISTVRDLNQQLADIRALRTSLEKERKEAEESLDKIRPFLDFNFNIHEILKFKFIKYRFGKIAHEYYEKLEKYVYDDLDTIFFKCASDEHYVWGIYFIPAEEATKIDAVYSSMHFERFILPDDYNGTPRESAEKLEAEIAGYNSRIEDCTRQIGQLLENQKGKLLAARDKLNALSSNFDIRKLAACTKEDQQVFYILCGWMSETDAEAFQSDIADDENLYCIVEDDENNIVNQPPTKLKNPKIFRPFEMFVRMYGLPGYKEMDPTIFIALTYSLIFGAMFGDVGQGLCLVVGGALLYRFKKMDLAAIVSSAGVFSTIFGFLYGSFFGFEDTVIKHIWLRPKEAMTNLPMIGSMNTVFVVAIVFGMGLILLTMVLHIVNGIRQKDVGNVVFDTNGIAGLVFYGSIVAVILLLMTGHHAPAAAVLVLMFGVPLILIALKEPLTKLAERQADAIPKEKGMFAVTAFFELFDVLLSYFSNTISFLRIGAFAVSHAAMMEVVLMLAGAENGGSPNWIVIVLGNVFVCAMEGLIVGIQVLRLEYYELFSRFYKGDGRAFTPFRKKQVSKSKTPQ
ncbi:MAG: V-type ATPase 116kDa subunit family protein [Eubacteriales bacterium]|nr:V-type ATPase 116kDa subunit family protein [Eubacteriales bacterium]